MKEIIEQANEAKARGAMFMEKSEYYPKIFTYNEYGTKYISTFVRFCRDGKWYTALCVDSIQLVTEAAEAVLYQRMMLAVHYIQNFSRLSNPLREGVSVDKLQITESERTNFNKP